MRYDTSNSGKRLRRRAFGLAAVVAGVAALALFSRSDAKSATTSNAATTSETTTVTEPERLRPSMIVRRSGAKQRPNVARLPSIVPAGYVPREHYYGPNENAFIRQPHDYGDDTPATLGGRTGHTLFDLERVQDMVRRGDEANSEFARLDRGVLLPQEKRAARQVLQAFFDESTIVVDAVMDGVVDPADAFAKYFMPRRERLNADLRDALNLSSAEFYELWPHIRSFDRGIARLHSTKH